MCGRAPHTLTPLFEEADALLHAAETIRPPGNDDASLRWKPLCPAAAKAILVFREEEGPEAFDAL